MDECIFSIIRLQEYHPFVPELDVCCTTQREITRLCMSFNIRQTETSLKKKVLDINEFRVLYFVLFNFSTTLRGGPAN